MVEVKLGAATATRIEESYEPNFDAKVFFPDWTPEVVREHGGWMSPNHYDEASGWLKLSIHSWLLKLGGKTILIDTCVGNHKPRKHRPKWDMMNTPYLERLKAAGVTPDQVDMVMCTHLHVDHVGWNTRLVDGHWLPTFPNARYVFAAPEFEYWQATTMNGEDVFGDSVAPIAAAGLADLVPIDHRLDGSVRLDPTTGHTPGHVSVVIESAGERAVITGDMIHTPLQVAEVDRSSAFDYDQTEAASTRRSFLERYADDTLVIGTHWGGPGAARVRSDGIEWRLEPAG